VDRKAYNGFREEGSFAGNSALGAGLRLAEITEISPPTTWPVRGVDGPVMGIVKGTVEPLDDGGRSRVTIEHAEAEGAAREPGLGPTTIFVLTN
jgi:hypothetical protein